MFVYSVGRLIRFKSIPPLFPAREGAQIMIDRVRGRKAGIQKQRVQIVALDPGLRREERGDGFESD